MNNKKKLKRDRYYKARGGTAQFLSIFCSQCNTLVAIYQKDGPGNLFRLYLDRISDCETQNEFIHKTEKKDLSPLKCHQCNNIIGIPMMYEPEKRLAFRLINGASHKKKVN